MNAGLLLAAFLAAAPQIGLDMGEVHAVHLAGARPQGLELLVRDFELANPGYRVRWQAGCEALAAKKSIQVAFVQAGSSRAKVGTVESDATVGDIVLLRAGESASFAPACDLLVFETPTELPGNLPTFVRPDWDPKITDTPGGCATETGAYRRILLTWEGKNGPYQYRALNAHRVRITDSFTHYHPQQNGFDELYLVQHASTGARLWVGEDLPSLLDPARLDASGAKSLLRPIEVHTGDLVYLPRDTAHRGVGGILAQIITVPGFVPGAEIPLDERIEAINARFSLAGEAALPFHRARPRVEVQPGAESIELSIGGKPFTTYRFAGGHPCFFPLRTPAGTEATRAFPLETREGEATDHPHHRSVWFAHGAVGGHDFWQGDGTVKQVASGASTSGEGRGSFEVEDEWLAGDGSLVARDRRRFAAFELDGAWGLDLAITLRASERELVLGDTKEGSLAVRLAPGLAVTEGGALLDSEGRRDDAVWGKRARWVLASGKTRGAQVALAMFDHPGNPRHPTTWHARNYGLVAANPFGLSDFEGAAKGAGDLSVPAQGELVLRWRVMVFDQVPSAETLDAIARDFASAR